MLGESIHRQRSGSCRSQDEQTARDREILFEMQELVSDGEIGMEQESGCKAEQAQA